MDVLAVGVFVTLAGVISLTLWTEYRSAQEKRERLERFRRQL